MNQEAIDYFYPNGFWGGCNRFFYPALNSKTSDLLIKSIRKALLGDEKQRFVAIDMLQSTHLKNVSPPGSKPPFPKVECYPTEEAKVAIDMLSK